MSQSFTPILNPVAAIVTGRPVSTLVDISAAITTGGVAQVIALQNLERRGFWIQNLSSGDIFVSSIGTASAGRPSIRVPPGALYEAPTHGAPTGPISVFGATTGQSFSAREW